MSSNLANIYAALLREYGENYMITYAAAPSYLRNIIGSKDAEGKMIFFYVEDRSGAKELNLLSPSKLSTKRSTDDDLDLTGSPLKDDCVVDAIGNLSLDMKLGALSPWKPEEEYHRGVNVEKARSIICSMELQSAAVAAGAGAVAGAGGTQGSVWFLCSAGDIEKTLLLQYEFVERFYSRGIVRYMGILPARAVNSSTLLRQHCALGGGIGGVGGVGAVGGGVPIETSIENIYRLKSNVAIRCAWSTSAPLPSLTDFSSCDVTVLHTFRLNDCAPPTENLVNQLRILMYIRDDIVAYRNGPEPQEAIYRCGPGIGVEELREDINSALTEISGFAEIETASGVERDIEEVVQRAKQRRLTDLTDKLWEILKRCSSYKDLKVAFNILFQCAARCNMVNIPTNKNRLAEIITEIANRRLAIPCLSGSEPLELLLEIGLEKLYKDYEFIFVESKVCSANDLKNKSDFCIVKDSREGEVAVPSVRKSLRNAIRAENSAVRKTLLHTDTKARGDPLQTDRIVTFKNSHFDEQETAERLARLLQIHYTLEHLLVMQMHLNLSNVYREVYEQLMGRAPRVLDSLNDGAVDEVEIQLSAHYVREYLEGKDPHSRRITMRSRRKMREARSTFFFSMENVCPDGVAECFQAEDKEYCTENIYHNWLYRKIRSVKSH